MSHNRHRRGRGHAPRPALPSHTAALFTTPECWAEHFPARPCPPGRDDAGAAVCIIGADHTAELAALGFEVVPGIVPGTTIPGLFCPHLAAEEALT